MSWDVDFEARPFKLKLTRSAKQPRVRLYRWWSPPDQLYRKVTRRTITRLIAENAALRRDINRPPSTFARALVWALRQALRRQP